MGADGAAAAGGSCAVGSCCCWGKRIRLVDGGVDTLAGGWDATLQGLDDNDKAVFFGVDGGVTAAAAVRLGLRALVGDGVFSTSTSLSEEDEEEDEGEEEEEEEEEEEDDDEEDVLEDEVVDSSISFDTG